MIAAYTPTQIPDFVITEMKEYVLSQIYKLPEANITQSVSEWAEKKRRLTSGLTARPGPFRFDSSPYLREIADCLSDLSPVQEIIYMKGTQVGGTVGIIENFMGYCIDHGLGPVLFISGDQAMAEESMSLRVDQMIDAANLQGKIKPNTTKKNQKNTGDKVDTKNYGGTFMRAVGPNSESKLRTFPMRFVLGDEVDVWPLNIAKNGSSAGNPIEKIERRTDSYGNLKKLFYISTPKQKNTSQIEPKFDMGDKRYYNFKCPECGKYQPFVWGQFKWDKNENGKADIQYTTIAGVEIPQNNPTYYECINPDCKRKIKEYEKYELLLEQGHGGTAKWIPTKKADKPFMRSYHTNALYGFRPWLDIVLHFEEVKDDIMRFPDFVNDVLGETWEERVESPDKHFLMEHAEDWDRGYISDQAIFLTLTADIQGNRIEASLHAWGRDKRSWAVDYWTFEGEPHEIESKCWKKLHEKITNTYRRADGMKMLVDIAFIDSQYNTSQVNTFCDQFNYHPESISGVYPILARDAMTHGVIVKATKNDISTPKIALSDQKLKFALYNTLRLKPYANGFPFGYIHFSHGYGAEYYDQLTAEEIFVETRKNGKKITTIENRKQRRNEVFDIMKYHIAAYQFAIDRFFEIENAKRKLQKMPEIQTDNEMFMDAMQKKLYDRNAA